MTVGFIGLGRMGRNMAGRLLERGFPLRVWNRSPAASEALRAQGATVAASPAALAGCDIVITMLADDAAVEAVWVNSGLIEALPKTTLHLNMASVSLDLGQRLTELHRKAGLPYVAAPVFGRPEPAATGQLDIIAAGADEQLARCEPLFAALGRRWFKAGNDPACANIVKIARNFLLGSIIESLGEAFALVGKSGVDPAAFHDIITSTSMNCPAYKNYGQFILNEPVPPTFTLNLGLKDVELALQAGEATGVPMPLAALLGEQHRAAIKDGYGEREWAALGRYIAERAGVK